MKKLVPVIAFCLVPIGIIMVYRQHPYVGILCAIVGTWVFSEHVWLEAFARWKKGDTKERLSLTAEYWRLKLKQLQDETSNKTPKPNE